MTGELEYWSGGVMGFRIPTSQYSNTPLLHHSNLTGATHV
jgi:hypothetical protein